MPHRPLSGLAGARVAVFGATGHTGRFVVSELLRRGASPIAIARDADKLESAAQAWGDVPRRIASVNDAEALDRAIEDTVAVINCAGPFLETADAVAAAAMRAGAHYLDIAAEQASVHATLERFDAAARGAGVVVLPGMGFYGGFADLLVTAALGDWKDADAIEVGIGLDSWHPTAGTRRTGERNTAQRQVIREGRLVPLPSPAPGRKWRFPTPLGTHAMTEVPFSEAILIARHVRTNSLHAWLSDVALDDLRDRATPPPTPVDGSGRSAQRFAVEAVVRRGGESRHVLAHGRDIYAVTAPLVCQAAHCLLGARGTVAGAHAPGTILAAGDFLSSLAPDHLTLETTFHPAR